MTEGTRESCGAVEVKAQVGDIAHDRALSGRCLCYGLFCVQQLKTNRSENPLDHSSKKKRCLMVKPRVIFF